jgi:hypothetical protein
MIGKLRISLWYIRRQAGLTAGVPAATLNGSGEGYFFGVRNRKEFFLSVLTSRRSEVDIVLQADEHVRIGISDLKIRPTWNFLFHLGRAYWIKPVAGYDIFFKKFIAEVTRTLNLSAVQTGDLPGRINNLIAAYHFFRDVLDVRPRDRSDLTDLIFLLSDYLYRFGDKTSGSYTPLSNALALLASGMLFKNSRAGKKWTNRATDSLERYLSDRRGNLPVEEIEPATMLVVLSQINKIRADSRLTAILHKVYLHCLNIPHDTPLRKPVFSLSTSPDEEKYSDLFPVGAVLFGDPMLKQAQPHFTEKALWLLGMEGYEKFQSM